MRYQNELTSSNIHRVNIILIKTNRRKSFLLLLLFCFLQKYISHVHAMCFTSSMLTKHSHYLCLAEARAWELAIADRSHGLLYDLRFELTSYGHKEVEKKTSQKRTGNI